MLEYADRAGFFAYHLAEHHGTGGPWPSTPAGPEDSTATSPSPTTASASRSVFFENFNYLWAEHGDHARHAARGDFDRFVGQGLMTCGSPDTVRARLQEYLDVTGSNYLAGVFAFGGLSEQQVMRSLHLFTTGVMPRLRARA